MQYARRAEVPPGRMSLNTSAQAGYQVSTRLVFVVGSRLVRCHMLTRRLLPHQQQPAFEMHQAAFVVPSSSAATLELFGWGSPFGLDQATFGGMVRGFCEAINALAVLTTVQANHPIHVPATDAFQESDLVNAVPSISRLHRTATSEAGPSSNRREPAASEIECGQREAKKAVGASRKGRVAGARSRRAEKVSQHCSVTVSHRAHLCMMIVVTHAVFLVAPGEDHHHGLRATSAQRHQPPSRPEHGPVLIYVADVQRGLCGVARVCRVAHGAIRSTTKGRGRCSDLL